MFRKLSRSPCSFFDPFVRKNSLSPVVGDQSAAKGKHEASQLSSLNSTDSGAEFEIVSSVP